jgi:hypothetical protein
MFELHGISSVGERGRYFVGLQDGSLLFLKPANLRQLDTLHRSHSQGHNLCQGRRRLRHHRPEC